MLLYVCPYAAVYVSGCCYICVLILLYVSSYCYTCVLILLYMCPQALRHLHHSIILNGFEGLITPLRAAATARNGWLDLKTLRKGCPLGFNTAQAQSVEEGVEEGVAAGMPSEAGMQSVRLDTVIRVQAVCGGVAGQEAGGLVAGGEQQGAGLGAGGRERESVTRAWQQLAVAVTAVTSAAVECEVFLLKIDTDGAEAAVLCCYICVLILLYLCPHTAID
jgi:hypothetical protein